MGITFASALPQCMNMLDLRILNLKFILELQKLSQIEKYHSFIYIAFRAQIWGMISFATFASMYFSQARFRFNIQSYIHSLELQQLSKLKSIILL